MPPPTTSTSYEAQRLVAFFVGGLRFATIVQMAPSLPTALGGSEHLVLASISWIAALGTLAWIGLVVVVRRDVSGTTRAVFDVAVAVALLAVGLVTVPEELRTGTWEGFQMGYAVCVALSLVGVRRCGTWMVLLLTLVAAEVMYLAPTVEDFGDLPTVAGNLLTVLALGPLAWIGAGVILRLGEKADEARRYAARVAREEEERRARLAVHNGTALLRLLVDGPADEAARVHLRAQAEAEVNRMRAYLSGTPRAEGGDADLAALVASVGDEYADMPLTVVADLAVGVRLEPGLAEDLGAALRSLLLNVRQHARAERVVVHAEEPADGNGWIVTVHDDGVGFVPDRTTYGVGLREIVIEQLATHGVAIAVTSMPNLGTTITLRLQNHAEGGS